MQFKRPTKKQPSEAIIPMINVVFLLLIFFLMSASIAAPPPFELTLPKAANNAELGAEFTLYIAQDGAISTAWLYNDAVWQNLAETTPTHIAIRADQDASAGEVAGILRQLSTLGVAQIDLAVTAK